MALIKAGIMKKLLTSKAVVIEHNFRTEKIKKHCFRRSRVMLTNN